MHNTDKADVYYKEQIAAYENAIQLDPNNAEAWFNKGYALAGMKRYDEAITIFDKVQSLDPDYPNLALSQKQAKVLRDAAAPVYVKYSVPIIAVSLVLIIVAGYYFFKRKNAECPEDSEPENRQSRRRKEK
jgi:tetratricopeptide (TPR) repeat protein